MPMPSVEPMPPDCSELRLAAPDEAQEASYLAASERIASFSRSRGQPFVHDMFYLRRIAIKI